MTFLRPSPTLQAARAASVEQIAAGLKKAGHPSAANGACTIVETLRQPQLEASAVTTRTKSHLALALIAHLVPLVEHIASSDKDIEDLF